MSEESIISIINILNRNPNYKNCIKHLISKNVDFAHIWIENSRLKHSPKPFFLIKKDTKYVGAVLDMKIDLHWVILPEHRKNGYLTTALKEAIIPYLFSVVEREELKISINGLEIGNENYDNSLSTALKVGFKKVDDTTYILEERDFDFSNEELDIKYKGLADDEIEGICKELNAIAKKVSIINSKIELSMGQSPSTYMKPSLDDMSYKLSYFTTLIDDIKHDYIQDN
ncbi:GNAT family N-acetyltransferase [Flavobacterium acetivorans]|uniref:GNAT family N-acetyltransferase n=1 Tax=Flavobacterium acetivorans TaxID=2893883 RepID=UPI001E4535F8|nr:GNAT family N-acetyltransferase [Flavobacterium sp. F-29]UFH34432.1 GNAT family N-acetyltransferase [Flavobacterium sp. F-29]